VPSDRILNRTSAIAALIRKLFHRSPPEDGKSGSRPAPGVRVSFGPALDAAETVAVCAVEQSGRITYWNAGAAKLFGRPAREMEGTPAGGSIVAADEERAFLQEVDAVFSSGRARPGRRETVADEFGRRVDVARTLLPVIRYGKTVEVAVVFVETRAAGGDERQARLLDDAPIALLGLDGEGRIETVAGRLSAWTGRRVEILEGMEAARADIFPPSLGQALDAVSRKAPRAAGPEAAAEFDEVLLPLEGAPRPVHVLAAARPGGGASVVLVDGASRRTLLDEGDAARSALVEARRAAADAIESTARELRVSAESVAEAVRRARDEQSGPIQKAKAEVDLAETTREFLRRIDAFRIGRRPSAPRVLLVEDNDENRELLAHMLRSRGAEVVAVSSGCEALEAASRQPFSFVLLDLQMPEIDGYQVLRRLRALPVGEALPVVALTALTSEDVRRRCEAEGMNDFVTKPVTLARIRELVDRWGGKAAVASQRPQADR